MESVAINENSLSYLSPLLQSYASLIDGTKEKILYTYTSPSKVVKENELERAPGVLYQQKMACKVCSYESVIHQGTRLIDPCKGWVSDNICKDFYPNLICGLCYERMERVGEMQLLWPHHFPIDRRDTREEKLRGGQGSLLGEDKYWIYWSDGLKMAQHSMITHKHSEAWWKHYHSIHDCEIEQPVVLVNL